MLHSTQHTAPGLDSQIQTLFPSGRRRGSRRAAAATSPTRADLPRPRRWRGQACTAGAGPRGREGRHARRARERRRRRLARAGLRGVGRGTICSGRSARSAQLGDDEGDHAARSASRGQEPTPSSPPGRRIETSLRRKRVRGGGSRRACGAPVCLRQEGAAGAGGASERRRQSRACVDGPGWWGRGRRTSRQLESASRRAQTCRRLGWRLWAQKRQHSMSTRRRRLKPRHGGRGQVVTVRTAGLVSATPQLVSSKWTSMGARTPPSASARPPSARESRWISPPFSRAHNAV